ncbi:hypothetical protein [Candidatus Deianiraea vastatrix]|uniref:Uncharacterized protein n=1 Tax=Candidatus Deianiraea vastatrix TaxID=2163644 RepID=A0A5B8XG63_9RICK|nr:hypothetical protein [Candidatus Deianiraea vastatrix]QED23855.1 hypothetical protein Deia_01074 [Candidatus Deianiraea vastatrix]
MKTLSTSIVLSTALFANANAADLKRLDGAVMQRLKSNFEGSIAMSQEKGQYEFKTPAGGSILTYDKMKSNQFLWDAKYKIFTQGIDNFFVYASGNFGKIRKGEVRDDDVRNLASGMSFHQLGGNLRQRKIGIGYSFDASKLSEKLNSHIISFDIAYFKKNVNTKSYGHGYSFYGSQTTMVDDGSGTLTPYTTPETMTHDYDNGNDLNSNGIFEGLSIGSKIEKIIDQDSSISLAANALITSYRARNFWRARDINWGLHESGNMGLNGFDMRAEYLTNITNHVDLSLFAYYQQIKTKKLNEFENGEGYMPSDMLIHSSYAFVKSYGIGAGFKFS